MMFRRNLLRPGRRVVITTALTLASTSFAYAQEPTAPACAQNDPVCPPPNHAAVVDVLATGLRVRISTAELVEVPNVARLDRQRFHGKDISIDWENGTVTLLNASGVKLTLPQPNTVVVGEIVRPTGRLGASVTIGF